MGIRSRIRVSRGLVRAGLTVAILLSSSACAKPADVGRYSYMRVTLNGFQTLGVSVTDKLVRGVVVYFHDAGANEFVLTDNPTHLKLTSELTDAGFAVISGSFGVSGFGDPAMVRSYLELGNAAATHYRAENLYLLAESMGSLPAVSLLASIGDSARVRGLAAIKPVLDLDAVGPRYEAAVAKPTVPGSNPMQLNPQSLRGRKIAFFVPPDNPQVATQVDSFNQRFGFSAAIDVFRCPEAAEAGATCFQGDEIVEWFKDAEHRGAP
ncbi:Uncharacterised protein [Mycobacteroides abscessus subsp. abscessus]|nr:Uncharacterised protein [Mycobacteroides abscessus subsp. abscessus]